MRNLLVLCGLLATIGLVSAANWPRFRGPNGTGIAAQEQLPVQWNEKNILWKVALPGYGNSSPVVWKDRLFVQSATKDGSKRMLLCLSAKTGKTLWEKEIKGKKAHIHQKNSWASSTPAVDGERVYASFWDGKDIVLAAFTMNGKLVWQKDLGSFTSQHGAGASPIIYKDKVIFFNDQDFKSKLIAFDAKTGDIVWQQPRPAFRASYSSPFLWQRNGKEELVVISTKEFTGYNPDTGNINWKWKWKHVAKRPLRVTGSPVFLDNVVYGASGDGGGDRYTVALRVNGKGQKVHPEKIWSYTKDFPYVPTMLAYKGYVYFTNDKGTAGCYHAKTGDRIWLERVSEVPFTASPVIVDGKIYAVNEDGDVYVLTATPAFQVLARNSLGELVRATPAVANNRIYIRGRNHLFCVGERKAE